MMLPVKMNPGLAMGEDLLKKRGIMIFGEPDVEIKGVDVYDPIIGEIRSSPADDITCWFIDSDGELIRRDTGTSASQFVLPGKWR